MSSTALTITKTVRVKVAPARAFEIFTGQMSQWWFKQGINKVPIKDLIVEPRAGGRWFERGEDGSECQWGKVVAWQPPGRVLLALQLNSKWQFDSNLHTEVEVRFTADGTGTLVELEHRGLEALGADAEEFAKELGGGWTGLLENFSKLAG